MTFYQEMSDRNHVTLKILRHTVVVKKINVEVRLRNGRRKILLVIVDVEYWVCHVKDVTHEVRTMCVFLAFNTLRLLSSEYACIAGWFLKCSIALDHAVVSGSKYCIFTVV